jgi:hypothetical protein
MPLGHVFLKTQANDMGQATLAHFQLCVPSGMRHATLACAFEDCMPLGCTIATVG